MEHQRKRPLTEAGRPAELDELQRGEEEPISAETLEHQAPPRYGQESRREIPVPAPGERPGAIRLGRPGEEEAEESPATGERPGRQRWPGRGPDAGGEMDQAASGAG